MVLTVTQMLRKKGVVGKFVEFYGPGLDALSLPDRLTIANMAPEYGATCGFFPTDAETIRYLAFTGRDVEQVRLVEAYAKAQGLWRDAKTPDPLFSDSLSLDLDSVEPSLAGPKRPQDRVALSGVKRGFAEVLPTLTSGPLGKVAPVEGRDYQLTHGDVVIAAITSCTNTSNPSVLVAAGLLARKAVEKGLTRKPWVKTSLAPGSQVVADYLAVSGLQDSLNALGFYIAGFGCTTCIGNSGPLDPPIAKAVDDNGLVVGAVLSGNRQFRRAHQPAGQSQLSGLAAAGGRLCHRGHPRHRHQQRAAGHRQGRQTGLPEGHLADERRDQGDHRRFADPRDVPQALCRRLPGPRAMAGGAGGHRRDLLLGQRLDLCEEPALFHRLARSLRPPSPTSRAHVPWPSSAIRSPPTIFHPPATSRRRLRAAPS